MTKEKLLEIVQSLLKADGDLNFLMKLEEDELETLVACVRERIDQIKKQKTAF